MSFRLCFALVACVSSVLAISPSIPAFLWEGSSGLLASSSLEVTDSLSTTTLAQFIKFAAGATTQLPNSLTPFVNAQGTRPEVLVIFLQPNLHTAQVSAMGAAFQPNSDGGAFKNLKGFMGTSSKSLSLPYTFNIARQTLLDEVEGVANVHVVDAKDAPAFFHSRQSLFSDHKTDVIIAKFDALKDGETFAAKLKHDDEMMAEIVGKLEKSTQGKYLAMLTASSPISGSIDNWVPSNKQSHVYLSIKASANKDDVTYPLYMTPGVLSGLVISLLLIVIVSVGVTGLFALETPDQWETEGGFLAGQ